MKKWHIAPVLVMLVAFAVYFGYYAPRASAHEGAEAGDYEIEFGWQVEPAYAGVYNGPELTIHNAASEEPVTGAEETLKLKVKFGSKTKQLALEPAWNDPGHYLAYMTPTRPGDYAFELTGTISSTGAITPTVVNMTFDSADGHFSTVEPASDVLFPDTTADIINLQHQIDAFKAQVDQLEADVAALNEQMQ
jgi:hypothetical protein